MLVLFLKVSLLYSFLKTKNRTKINNITNNIINIISYYIMIITLLLVAIIIFSCIYIYKKKNMEPFSNNLSIYVINLNESKDRLKLITSQLNKQNLQFTRFPAINGKNLDLPKLKKQNILQNDNMKKGTIGCSLSHITLWKKLAKQKNQYNIILEDDVIIQSDFKRKLHNILDNITIPFDILYLGGSNIHGKKINDFLIKPIYKKKLQNVGTYAMLINKKCLDTIIKKNLPIDNDIDQSLNKRCRKLKVYYVYPPLVTHNNELDSMRRIYSNQTKQSSKRWLNHTQKKITII